jgi:HAMP domain-containing protein
LSQPVADFVFAVAPYALLALAAGAIYLALLACVSAEARARVRAWRRLGQLVEALERGRPTGVPPSPRLAAARERLERVGEDLVRDGIPVK